MRPLRLLPILFLLGLYSCQDFPILPDCPPQTAIIMEPAGDCAVPCTRTFRLKDPGLLADGARVTWRVQKGNETIVLDDPNALEFTMEVTEPSNDYLASVSIVYDFEGCDQEISYPFTGGTDLPKAEILVSRQRCVVGDCEITFTAAVENADSWSWHFPGDEKVYQDDSIVVKSFDERPDTLTVRLTASNLAGSTPDSVTVFIDPVTFIAIGEGSELEGSSVFYVSEQANGSFILVENDGDFTYNVDMSREGVFLTDTRKEINELDSDDYYDRMGIRSFDWNEEIFLVGHLWRSSTNTDAYLVAWDENMNLRGEKRYSFAAQEADNGHAIAPAPDGGYVLCGRKSEGISSTSMVFFKLNEAFEEEATHLLSLEGVFEKALGIVPTENGYAVVGKSGAKAYFFETSLTFELKGEVQFLGEELEPERLIALGNGGYLMLGYNPSDKTGLVQPLGTLDWAPINLGNSRPVAAELLGDGMVAIAGYTKANGMDTPFLFTLNWANGTLEGIDKVYHDAAPAEIYSISRAIDGGFLMGGRQRSPHAPPYPIVIRTDKLGHIY